MEGIEKSRFVFGFISKSNIRCVKLTVPRLSLFVKAPDWLSCKNATTNPENINDRCFQYTCALIQQ